MEISQIFPSGLETLEKGDFTELKFKTFPPWSQTPQEAGTFAVHCFGSLSSDPEFPLTYTPQLFEGWITLPTG